MRRVHLTPAADGDLEGIFEFTLERYGLKQARIYRAGFQAAFDLLAEHTLIGSERYTTGHPVENALSVHRLDFQVLVKIVAVLEARAASIFEFLHGGLCSCIWDIDGKWKTVVECDLAKK